MATILSTAGVILERSALAVGFLAAMIAVGGFLARTQALLGSDFEPDLQLSAAIGGLQGFLFGLLIILIDALFG